jgi:hypothetical protein
MTYTDVPGDRWGSKFLAGEMPATFRVRTAPRFQTGHPGYAWLNRLQCLGVGEADLNSAKVTYDVYAVV